MMFFTAINDFLVPYSHIIWNGTIAVFVIVVLNFIWTFYKTRSFYRNLPGPPHSWLFGHLPALIAATRRFPPDIHPQVILNSVVEEYNLRDAGVMYLDTFPVRSDNQMIIIKPSLYTQIASHHVMRRAPTLTKVFGRVIGLKSLTLMEGAQWKHWRGMLNPSFGPSNVMSMLPGMLEEGEVFLARLSAIADSGEARGGYTPSILRLLKDLTADVIIRLTVGQSTGCQKSPNLLVDMICAASRWPQPASVNPLKKLDFRTNIALWYYNWRCRKIIGAMVQERWEEIKSGKSPESKVVLDLALHNYWKTLQDSEEPVKDLDPEIEDIICDTIKGFIFGGQDTTANSASWTLYMLSHKPEIVTRLRCEHDEIFGPDTNAVSSVLKAKPHLINELPWTTAVIKESMRFFAPASSLRAADDSMVLRDPNTGIIYPTKDQLIFMPNHILQRDLLLFHNPHEFIPARFMPDTTDSQKIDPDAYRPFERGPRACIGTDFAMTELKMILVMVVRKFSFENAYEELNSRRGTKIESVEGEGGMAYPVLHTTNQPKDGLPMWIKNEF